MSKNDYLVQCAYLDTDESIKLASKVFYAENEHDALLKATAYFERTCETLDASCNLYSTPKIATRNSSGASIGGHISNTTIVTGNNNVAGKYSVHIGDVY